MYNGLVWFRNQFSFFEPFFAFSRAINPLGGGEKGEADTSFVPFLLPNRIEKILSLPFFGAGTVDGDKRVDSIA